MDEAEDHRRSFAFSLDNLLVVLAAFALGIAVANLAFDRQPPMVLLWGALSLPAMFLLTILAFVFNLYHTGSQLGEQAAYLLLTGALYGFYAVLALWPGKKVYLQIALAAHAGCIVLLYAIIVGLI